MPAGNTSVDKAVEAFTQAHAEWRAQRWDQAARHAERSAALFARALGPHDPDRANAQLLAARARLTDGDHKAAHHQATQALRTLEGCDDSGRVRVFRAQAHGLIGRAHEATGDYPPAMANYRRALSAAQSTDQPDLVCQTAMQLGVLCKHTGDYDQAADAYRTAEKALRAAAPRDDEAWIALDHNRGGLHHASGNPEAALPYAIRALQRRQNTQPPDPVAIALERSAVAPILIDLERYDEAQEHLDAARETFDEHLGPVDYELAVVEHNLGELARRRHNLTDAITHWQAALQLKTQTLGPRHPDLAITHLNLAVVHHQAGNPVTANQCARQAIALVQDVGSPTNPVFTRATELLSIIVTDQQQAGPGRDPLRTEEESAPEP
ncbi:hypothetical protein AYO39_01405 [Actinobacteria bacterium SCGC AG-212-D09]|nr:hypothetical protein AYO39_01405 [Actinobacteria bacterium SCGC AG-212-D09]